MATPWIGAEYQPRSTKWFSEELAESDVRVVGQRARRTGDFSLEFEGGFSDAQLNGVRGRVTANFSLDVYTAVTLQVSLARKTASFQVLPGISTTLVGQRQRRTGSFAMVRWTVTTLAGSRRRRTASFALARVTTVSLAGSRQARTASFQVLPSALLDLSGVRRPRTASISIMVPSIVTLVGTRQRRTAAFQVVPWGSVTSLDAVRRRRQSQIAVDVTNDTVEELAKAGNVVRWIFRDTVGGFAHLPINPREMSTPTESRNMNWAWGATPGAVMRGVDLGADEPTQWSFTGVSLTKAHYDLLSSWIRKVDTIQITDHLDRTFETIIQRFDPIERLPTATRDWRTDYTMTCLLLRRVA